MFCMAWSPVRRTNAGRFEVDHPGDYATLNSYHPSYGTARYFECFENDCDLVLHCRHAHIEGGGNDLVAFSLHQERKHLDLSIGQPETAQNFACRQSVCKPRRRRFLTVE